MKGESGMMTESLLDILISERPANSLQVVERDGKRYVYLNDDHDHILRATYYPAWCKSYHNGLYCERPTGHTGPHLAWDLPEEGRLFTHGYWENKDEV